MEFSIKSGSPEKQRSACVVIGVFETRKLTLAGEMIDRVSNGYLSDILRRGDMEGKIDSTLLLHNVPNTLCDRVLLVGLGKERDFRDNEYRKAIKVAIKTLNETGSLEAVIYLTELGVKKRDMTWHIEQAVIVSMEAVYRFDKLKSKQDEVRRPLRKLTLCVERRNEITEAESAVISGQAIANGMNLAKDLGNLPGNICTPTYLAEQAQGLSKTYGIQVEVLNTPDIEKLGMHSFLSVAKGSRQPPKLIVLHYNGGPKKTPPVVLVGKGITFDAGGISLKPAGEMDEMKYDMCGAASVLGTFKAIAQMQLALNVVGIIPTCENLPDGDANKPGDVVTSMSGQTIEILNTDAEGRMVLADAVIYAENQGATRIVDMATLTGAVIIALGDLNTAVLGNDQELVDDIIACGKEAGENFWQLPISKDYSKLIKSDIADIKNIGGGRKAGTIIGAVFIQEFIKDAKWAHLDIAGTAWADEVKPHQAKGPTAVAVRTLIKLVDKSQ